ncbi:MAG: glycosyl hydrolase, partial [Marivirga sp.]|nr:glycosyl hydrolase [Marivirga sp.]
MRPLTLSIFILLSNSGISTFLYAQPGFKAVVLAERGEIHESFVVAALNWLSSYSKQANFEYTVITNADTISETFLAEHKLFIQLNYPPYRWSDKSKAAFEDYIDNGKGAWIGFHHA